MISVFLVRACAGLLVFGGLALLAISIDMDDLAVAFYSIPFFAAGALLWGFSDIINLLHQIKQAVSPEQETVADVGPQAAAEASKPTRSIDEIKNDIERLKQRSA